MVGAVALLGQSTGNDVIDRVFCDSSEARLLECPHIKRGEYGYFCRFGGGASIRCREEKLRVKNVSAATVDTPHCTKHTTVLISWELYNDAPHSPSSFTVECYNQQHHTELSMINGTLMQISVGGLLSSTSYNCCVLAIYYGNYETEGRCTSTEILQSDSPTSPVSRSNDRQNIIGGVLGFIIVILIILLSICGGTLLRSKGVIPKR